MASGSNNTYLNADDLSSARQRPHISPRSDGFERYNEMSIKFIIYISKKFQKCCYNNNIPKTYIDSDYSIGGLPGISSLSHISVSGQLTPRTEPLKHDFGERPFHNGHGINTRGMTKELDDGASSTSINSKLNKIRRLSVITEGDGSSPIYSAIFNMLAGCGIVGLPVTYKHSGLILGISLMIFVAFISVYTLRLLVKTGKHVGVEDYERLTEKCFGMKGYYFLAITILLFDIGACLTYSIILGDSAHAVMKHLFNWNDPEDRKLVIIGAYILLILPFCLGKSHDFIEKISACAIGAVAIMIGVVCYYYFHQYRHQEVSGIVLFNDNSQQLLSALGTISFAFVK